MHVLIVEDDPSIGELIALILSEEDHKSTLVNTTDSATACLEGGGIDLIVTDLEHDLYSDKIWARMTQLRQSAPRTPLIVCTGHSEAAKAIPSEYAVAAVIMKPFDLNYFIAQVAGCLGLNTEPVLA